MVIFLQGSFTLLVHAYAGRTKYLQSDHWPLSPFSPKPQKKGASSLRQQRQTYVSS